MALDNKSRRRYLPIGTEPLYDSAYDRLKLNSYIFNDEKRSRLIEKAGDLKNDVGRIGSEISQLEGRTEDPDKGCYYSGENFSPIPAIIPTLEAQKAEIEAEFAKHQQQQINRGFQKPETMPPTIHERYVICLAKLDISTLELMVLKDNLNTAIEARTGLKAGEVRPFRIGRGMGKLRGGILVELDGQKCEKDAEGTIRIIDPNSPFNGILAYEYSRLYKEWSQANDKLNRKLDKQLNRTGVVTTNRPKLSTPPLPDYVTQRWNWKEEKMEAVKNPPIDWDDLIQKKLNELIKK